MKDLQTYDFILGKLKDSPIEDTIILAEELKIGHQELDSYLKSLLVDDYVEMEVKELREVKLTDEGSQYATNGTPEFQLLNLLTFGEKTPKDKIEGKLGNEMSKVAFNQAMKNKWLNSDKTHVERIVEEVED